MDKKWWTLIAVCLGTFMLLIDITIVNVALPNIQHELHASFAQLQWVVDAYALSLAALLLTTGSLADLYGRRLLFVIGMTIFTLGSLMCGIAVSPEFIIFSRAGQGVGGAIMFATSLALIAQAFEGKQRAKAFAVWGAVTGVAAALGPVLGGVITSYWTWRGIFFVNLPIGVIAIGLTLANVEESRDPRSRRPDWVGFATFTLALCSFVYGLIRAGEDGWGDLGVACCFGIAAAFFVTFVYVEHRGDHPMFDLSLFKVPTFSGGSLAAFAMNGTAFAMLLYIVIYLQDALGYSPVGTGVRLLAMSLTGMPVAIASGMATARVPIRLLIGPGLGLCALGLFLMTSIGAHSSWTHLLPGLVIAGIGAGLVNPALASTAVGVVEQREAGMASGINTTFRQVGIATGIAVYGTLFATKFTASLEAALVHTPLAGKAGFIATAVKNGNVLSAFHAVPPSTRATVELASRAAFASGLNEILAVSGTIAAVSAVVSFVLIRRKDFAAHSTGEARPTTESPAFVAPG